MTAPKYVGCPFRRDCPSCPWSGEIPAAATVSDARTGAVDGSIETAPGVALTNTEGLTHSDVTGRACHMVANTHPPRTASVRGGADA